MPVFSSWKVFKLDLTHKTFLPFSLESYYSDSVKTFKHVVGLKLHRPWGSINFIIGLYFFSMSFLFFLSFFKCMILRDLLPSHWRLWLVREKQYSFGENFKSSSVASCSEAHFAGRGPWFHRWFQTRSVCISAVIKKHRKCLCFCCFRTSVLSSCKQGMWKPLSFICLPLPSREGGILLADHLDFVWLW